MTPAKLWSCVHDRKQHDYSPYTGRCFHCGAYRHEVRARQQERNRLLGRVKRALAREGAE